MTAQRGFDDRLALLDLAGAGFRRGADARKTDWAGEELGGGKGRPGDEAQQHDEQRGLDRRRNAKAAKLRSVVNEKIAIAEQSVHRGQTMSHQSPLHILSPRALFLGASGVPKS